MSSDEGTRGRQDENDPFDESGSYHSKHGKSVREKVRNLLDKKVVERRGGKKSSHTHSGGLVGGDQYLYEEYNDHMVGSAYHPDDLCPSCGAPRGGSVYCPVSQLQHSNDEPMDPVGKSSRSRKNVVSPSNVGPNKLEEREDTPYSNDVDNMDPFEATAHASVGDNAIPDKVDTYGASTAQEPCYGEEETSHIDDILLVVDPNVDDGITPQNGEQTPYSRSAVDIQETPESEKREKKGVFGKIASIFKKKPKHKSHEIDADEKEKPKVILSDEAKKYIKSLKKKEEAHRKMISHEQTVGFRELLDDHKTAVKRMKKNISN